MASKKQCRVVENDAGLALQFLRPPGSSMEIVEYLQDAACLGLADPKIVMHLAEMGALFPKELAGAYEAFRKRQTGDN